MAKILLLLVLTATFCCAVKRRQQRGDYNAEADKVNMKGCANLTTVLDNWKFAIVTQFRNLLLYDHQTVLPDYGRIKALSDALDSLYKEFSTLKEGLSELTIKFDGIESFVEEMRRGRSQPSARSPRLETKKPLSPPAAPQMRHLRSQRRVQSP